MKPHHVVLRSTVLELRPRHILEIGTWKGTTAVICARAQEEAGIEDGLVVTADIIWREMAAEFLELEGERIVRVQVYPHTRQAINDYNAEVGLLPDWEEHLDNSLEVNEALIRGAMAEADVTAFDFAFVDGDHTALGLLRDLELVQRLTRIPHYALLDDVGGGLPSADVYRDYLRWAYECKQDELGRTALIWKG